MKPLNPLFHWEYFYFLLKKKKRLSNSRGILTLWSLQWQKHAEAGACPFHLRGRGEATGTEGPKQKEEIKHCAGQTFLRPHGAWCFPSLGLTLCPVLCLSWAGVRVSLRSVLKGRERFTLSKHNYNNGKTAWTQLFESRQLMMCSRRDLKTSSEAVWVAVLIWKSPGVFSSLKWPGIREEDSIWPVLGLLCW